MEKAACASLVVSAARLPLAYLLVQLAIPDLIGSLLKKHESQLSCECVVVGVLLSWRCIGFTKIVTWLILPVVICLSQRLSHACLSISLYTVRLRMAH